MSRPDRQAASAAQGRFRGTVSKASLRWHYEDGTWWAESPEFPEWSGGAESLDEARLLAHGGLRFMGATYVVDPFGPLPESVTS